MLFFGVKLLEHTSRDIVSGKEREPGIGGGMTVKELRNRQGN